MKYRSHRGGLDESLETQVEVNGIKELLEHINKDRVDNWMPKVKSIIIEFYVYDHRIPADVYLVSEVIYNMEHPDGKHYPIGMIDEPH
jgi:hypothetical protein